MLASMIAGFAQTAIDNFRVGPYIVDYKGQGDVQYRLQDNINLFEFFELKKDTTVIVLSPEELVDNAIVVSGNVGANRYASKEIGIEGVWKHNLSANKLYFGVGLLANFSLTNYGKGNLKRNMFEIGIPLQIELGKIDKKHSSLYGLFGIAPTFYSTMKAEGGYIPTKIVEDKTPTEVVEGNASAEVVEGRASAEVAGTKTVNIDVKKSGFLIATSLEFGGNIPVGSTLIRIGVYAKYKINCTTGDFDVYTKGGAGRMFLGAKIGFVL